MIFLKPRTVFFQMKIKKPTESNISMFSPRSQTHIACRFYIIQLSLNWWDKRPSETTYIPKTEKTTNTTYFKNMQPIEKRKKTEQNLKQTIKKQEKHN